MSVDSDFERLLGYVRDTRGFDYTGYRRPTLIRRFEKRKQTVGVKGWDEYRDYLDRHPDEFNELFNAILINVTGFFRDKETWDVVKAEVIPKLLEAREPKSPIRVWSAGCASGEEPYSISMLLAEAIGEEGFKNRVKIYATDIDDEALAQARDATYTAKQLEDVPAELRDRYFQPSDEGYAFRSDLRHSVIFGRNDLQKDPPISRVDLLVSRNTLMYFSPEIQERVLANFFFALNHGGFLVVGKAEALQRGRQLFAPYNLKRRIFVRDGSAEPTFRLPRLPHPTDAEPRDEAMPDVGDAAFEHGPVAQLVVGNGNNVLAINLAARVLFGLKLKDVGRPLQDLEVSYRPLELRSMLEQVRDQQRPVSLRNVEWQTSRGGPRVLDVQISPLLGSSEQIVAISVSFVDVTTHRTLEGNLEHARRELESAYEELQSTVEELETTNEELQSTNEELETTNEELQSTNEELETMNEELQSTNEELETMNDELRERTDEAVHANSFLASVLSSMDQAVVVVDRELRILAWSQVATDLWGLRPGEAEGGKLLNLDIGLPVAKLKDPIRKVLAAKKQEQLALEGHNRRGQSVRYTIDFNPLEGHADDTPPLGAILLVSAERTG